jgi:diacylglycerol kinase (ATP)
MPNKIKIILNAYGGRLGAKAKTEAVKEAMQAAGLDYHLEITQYAGHAVELARQASDEGWPVIVAAGGDGTIHEVINGLLQASGQDQTATLGIIPMGTANDLADVLHLPRDATAACQRIAAGNSRVIDVGTVNGQYFSNNSALGLEPVVTINHEQMRRVKGNLRYLLAALKSIILAKPWHMRLDWDDGSYEGPVTLVSVGNSHRTGGLFYMTPRAVLDDGLLDIVYGLGLTRWQLLRLLPKTLKGDHIHHPLVRYVRSKSVSITTSPCTPIQADGEVIDRTATIVNYSIISNKLRVIV